MKKPLLILSLMLAVLPASARDWKTEKGYRGNVETGFVIGCGDYGQTEWILQTTHGYQLIPTYLFVGGGAGVGVPTGDKLKVSGMVYGDVRSHFTKTKFSPFVDVKMGFQWNRNNNDFPAYNIQDGFYFSPSVGVDWAINSKFGLDLSVGYTMAKAPVYVGHQTDIREGMHDVGGFTVRIGFGF
ncbi:MAG: hypothetical protein NC328_00690 [Muribaculum sp.]|nr:hypothetical protein [Muribaculum sp.]